LAGSAIAGIVSLLPTLLVLLAPNPNSYRRFAPGNWAPRTATWGVGNYSCGLRVVAAGAKDTRLELRVPGADVDPHLALAMMLAAATWGVEGGLEPPDPVAAPADGRLAAGAPLPRNLTESVEQFRSSPAAVDLFGSAFVDHYAGSRQAEDDACRGFVPDGERDRYLDQV
jgi:glutamine synthetase